MDKPITTFWNLRLQSTKVALEKNNFQVHIASSLQDARTLVLEKLIPALQPNRISWGGSMTFVASGLYDELRYRTDFEVLDTFDKKLPSDQMLERRREALLVDLFITGTNAVTQSGQLVNLDMIGNRVGALTFGPKSVIVLAGRNKIVPDLEAAKSRIKDYASPTNVMRLDKKNPCLTTSTCHDCSSDERICNVWTITEKSFPKERIKIVLINDEIGL